MTLGVCDLYHDRIVARRLHSWRTRNQPCTAQRQASRHPPSHGPSIWRRTARCFQHKAVRHANDGFRRNIGRHHGERIGFHNFVICTHHQVRSNWLLNAVGHVIVGTVRHELQQNRAFVSAALQRKQGSPANTLHTNRGTSLRACHHLSTNTCVVGSSGQRKNTDLQVRGRWVRNELIGIVIHSSFNGHRIWQMGKVLTGTKCGQCLRLASDAQRFACCCTNSDIYAGRIDLLVARIRDGANDTSSTGLIRRVKVKGVTTRIGAQSDGAISARLFILGLMLFVPIQVIKRTRIQTSGHVAAENILATRNWFATSLSAHIQGRCIRGIGSRGRHIINRINIDRQLGLVGPQRNAVLLLRCTTASAAAATGG
ncbi:hypothetical protein SDC9_123217 [bioreactor metagenome]|uniref:Uncharacterized protein n=1 Tax=bioreactor metagenome TaxID=1076179 RepID=A0A645CH00_9ZZZZ